jgi:hypothetical protein
MKSNGHSSRKPVKAPVFVLRAERAFRRVARNVRAENRALNLSAIVWENGKVAKKSA